MSRSFFTSQYFQFKIDNNDFSEEFDENFAYDLGSVDDTYWKIK